MRMLVEALLAIGAGIAAFGCVQEAGEHVPAGESSACEQLAAERGAECATVRQFAMRVDYPPRPVELCVPDRFIEDAEQAHGISWPSRDDRFRPYAAVGVDPPCFWCASPGANALDGCWGVVP